MSNDTATAYLRTKVLTASPEQLRLLLLEGAVKFARQGRDGLAATPRNHELVFNGFERARNIVVELTTSLRKELEPTLRSRLQALYTYIFKLLMEASFEKNVAKADEAIKLLEYERETWEMAMRKAAEERAAGTGTRPTPTVAAAPAMRPALSVQG